MRSLQSGTWSAAATWVGGQVPTATHVVHVDPGHVVTIDDTSAVAYTIAVHGTLRFDTTVNTRLRDQFDGDGRPRDAVDDHRGVLWRWARRPTPIAPSVTAEIIIANTPLGGGVADPEQFGTGLLNFGKVTMHGCVKTPTFMRVAAEPLRGAHDVHAVGGGLGLAGRRPARHAGHPAHQGE